MLRKLGIVSGRQTKTGKLFEELFPNFMDIEYSSPSEYIVTLWNIYLKVENSNSAVNGKIFEYILATLFIREEILPLYLQTNVAFVPNINFDLMFYTKEKGPICLSAKTSLRERYKQADLEAIALKYVHRKALSYLVTLSPESNSVKDKIKTGEVIGIDDAIVATSKDFDNLIKYLKSFELEEPPEVKVIESNHIITQSKVDIFINHNKII